MLHSSSVFIDNSFTSIASGLNCKHISLKCMWPWIIESKGNKWKIVPHTSGLLLYQSLFVINLGTKAVHNIKYGFLLLIFGLNKESFEVEEKQGIAICNTINKIILEWQKSHNTFFLRKS